MAAASLFWDTNMAVVTSCENTLLKGNNTQTSLSEALRRHPFVNRSFAHLFEVDKFVEPFVLEPAFF